MSTNIPPPGEPLPHAPILSYVTNLSTTTRVRRVATIGVRLSAVLHLIISVWFVSLASPNLYYSFRGAGGIPALGDLWEIAPDLVLMFFALYCFCLGLFQLIVARQAYHGHRQGCQVLWVSLIGLYCCLGVTAIVIGAMACLHGLTVGHIRGNPRDLFWLLLSATLIITMLLVGDLMRLLKWIARIPTLEKPRTPFLPVSRADMLAQQNELV